MPNHNPKDPNDSRNGLIPERPITSPKVQLNIPPPPPYKYNKTPQPQPKLTATSTSKLSEPTTGWLTKNNGGSSGWLGTGSGSSGSVTSPPERNTWNKSTWNKKG